MMLMLSNWSSRLKVILFKCTPFKTHYKTGLQQLCFWIQYNHSQMVWDNGNTFQSLTVTSCLLVSWLEALPTQRWAESKCSWWRERRKVLATGNLSVVNIKPQPIRANESRLGLILLVQYHRNTSAMYVYSHSLSLWVSLGIQWEKKCVVKFLLVRFRQCWLY